MENVIKEDELVMLVYTNGPDGNLKIGMVTDGCKVTSKILRDMNEGRYAERTDLWCKTPSELFPGAFQVQYVLGFAPNSGVAMLLANGFTAVSTAPAPEKPCACPLDSAHGHFPMPVPHDAKGLFQRTGFMSAVLPLKAAEKCRGVLGAPGFPGMSAFMANFSATLVDSEHPGVQIVLRAGQPPSVVFTGEALAVPMKGALLKTCVLLLESKAYTELKAWNRRCQ
tara:strand:+ start:83 stop:757 length:675 start_codon:yes stop_codon:yes gene_type:complete